MVLSLEWQPEGEALDEAMENLKEAARPYVETAKQPGLTEDIQERIIISTDSLLS